MPTNFINRLRRGVNRGTELNTSMGLYGGRGCNPAAALIRDGEIVAFAEEERFNRVKMAPSAFPINAALYCLEAADISFDEINAIGFGWACDTYAADLDDLIAQQERDYPFPNYYEAQRKKLASSFDPSRIKAELSLQFLKKGYKFPSDNLRFFAHHRCHAASTFFASGFDEAIVLIADGSGERKSTSVWLARGDKMEVIKSIELPNSLGGIYSTFTEFLGFRPDMDEGKIMGLAPYGSYSPDLQQKLDLVFPFDRQTGDYKVNPYFRFLGQRSSGIKFTDKFCEVFGPPRHQNDDITEHHQDIAYNLQWRLEQIACALVQNAIDETGLRNVCIAGGVGMNCKMNGKISDMPSVANTFVQPASSDNGAALGAAYLGLDESLGTLPVMKHAYLGPHYSDEEIKSVLDACKLLYRHSAQIEVDVAQAINRGDIVGWFQGRMEVGARALGNRSILANPTFKNMKSKVNLEVKRRENWRPFCPALPIEAYEKYFGTHAVGQYMITAHSINAEFANELPSVVHVDGTARPQAVKRETNPKFHKLLLEFGKLSGHPVLLNTSFNTQGEPIIMSPIQAIRCFASSGIDILAIGNFLIEKRDRFRAL